MKVRTAMLVQRPTKNVEESKKIVHKPVDNMGHKRLVGEKYADLVQQRPSLGTRLQRTIGNQCLQRASKKVIPKAAITSDKLPQGKLEDKNTFMRKVYDAQLAHSVATKEFFAGLPADQTGEVEESFKLRKDAVKACKELLSQARSDLATQQKANDPQAVLVKAIGLASAYRSLERDFKAWQKAFETAYKQTASKRQVLTSGEHSEAAVQLLVKDMSNRKAIPGFSNHSKGMAVDFATTEDKIHLGPHKAQAADWRKSWFYNWLLQNAATYQFKQLPSEEWHWDFQGEEKGSSPAAGQAGAEQRVIWI